MCEQEDGGREGTQSSTRYVSLPLLAQHYLHLHASFMRLVQLNCCSQPVSPFHFERGKSTGFFYRCPTCERTTKTETIWNGFGYAHIMNIQYMHPICAMQSKHTRAHTTFSTLKWTQINIPSVYTGNELKRLIYMHLIHLTLDAFWWRMKFVRRRFCVLYRRECVCFFLHYSSLTIRVFYNCRV